MAEVILGSSISGVWPPDSDSSVCETHAAPVPAVLYSRRSGVQARAAACEYAIWVSPLAA